jgi:tRNA pseudouridine13 synthase
MAVSAIQSALFNLWVKARYDDGLTRTVLEGDVLVKSATGGMFTCESPEVDQARLESGEIGITGPMFGTKMMAAVGPAGEREQAISNASGLDARNWGAVGKLAEGTRRDMVVVPDGLSVTERPEGILFSFALPKGSYASVLMREFVNDTRGI